MFWTNWQIKRATYLPAPAHWFAYGLISVLSEGPQFFYWAHVHRSMAFFGLYFIINLCKAPFCNWASENHKYRSSTWSWERTSRQKKYCSKFINLIITTHTVVYVTFCLNSYEPNSVFQIEFHETHPMCRSSLVFYGESRLYSIENNHIQQKWN